MKTAAQAYGLDDQKAGTALRSLADSVKVRIERAMLSRGGVADVAALVTNPNNQLLEEPGSASLSAAEENGNDILSVLTGSKHISRGIAASAARQSGLPASTTEKLLPAVATLLVGELQRQSQPALDKIVQQSPSLFGELRNPLGGPGSPSQSSAPSSEIDAGPPPPIPGNTIPGVGRSASRRYQPDQDSPYDRLPDIVRRGGAPAPGGGSLEDVIRSIFGKVLGSNRGVIGTMIQIFLIRWLASMARRILSRVVTGR
nr:DUF937 domain-containing protein [Hyphomicrobium methylovorum]